MNNPYRSANLEDHPKKWPWKRWLFDVSKISAILILTSTITGTIVSCSIIILVAKLTTTNEVNDLNEECKSYVDTTTIGSKLECDHPNHNLTIVNQYTSNSISIQCLCNKP